MDQIPKSPSILKTYDSRKKYPGTCFMYLLVCHSKTCCRNCNVRNFEVILQCFSQHRESRSHNSPLLPFTNILWIPGSPVRLVWDNPVREEKHIYLRYPLFSGLSILIKAFISVCILKCSECLVVEVKSH